MTDPNCIFCKIVANELPSTKIFEDPNYIVIFDAFPHVEGQALLISKNHIASNFEELPEEVIVEAIKIASEVSKNLKKAFGALRVVQVTEGMEVDHMHIKLFPVVNEEKFSLAMLNEHYPQSHEMLTPDKFERLKKKYEEGKLSQ
jgi:histidine triad (HIT) family protein